MKRLAKTLILALSVALVCSSMFLTAFAWENPHELFDSDGHVVISPAEDVPRQRAQPGAGSEHGTQLRPEGHDLGFGASNAPALQGDVRIPRLEDAPEAAQAQEGVVPMGEPETPFVPAPHTGYASSRNMLFAAAALLGSALAISLKKPCRTS